MEITYISEQNKDSFAPLLPKEKINGETLMLGCIEEDEACAVLVAELDENIIKIRMIHTAQKYANRGAAKALVEYLCEIAGEIKADAVYATFSDSPVLEHLMDVSGFSRVEDECEKAYSFDFAGLDADRIGKTGTGKRNVEPMGKASPTVLNQIKSSLYSAFGKKLGTERLSDAYDPDLSMISVEGNSVKGYLLCKRDKDVLNVSFLMNLTKDNLLTLALLKGFYETVRNNVSNAPELKVRFKTADDSILNFLKVLVQTKIWEEEEYVTHYFFPPINNID